MSEAHHTNRRHVEPPLGGLAAWTLPVLAGVRADEVTLADEPTPLPWLGGKSLHRRFA